MRSPVRTSLALGLIVLSASTAFPCSIVGSLPTPGALIASADVIVVAVARERISGPVTNPPTLDEVGSEILFDITETLKGDVVAPTLTITGAFTDNDDFNDTPVTQNWPRPDARGGPCFAYSYRQGASYLLLLKRTRQHTLTPYWSALSRVNDQTRPDGDPWLEWVRSRVGGKRRGE